MAGRMGQDSAARKTAYYSKEHKRCYPVLQVSYKKIKKNLKSRKVKLQDKHENKLKNTRRHQAM